MKFFEAPKMDVVMFTVEDVITTSGNGGDGNTGGEMFD